MNFAFRNSIQGDLPLFESLSNSIKNLSLLEIELEGVNCTVKVLCSLLYLYKNIILFSYDLFRIQDGVVSNIQEVSTTFFNKPNFLLSKGDTVDVTIMMKSCASVWVMENSLTVNNILTRAGVILEVLWFVNKTMGDGSLKVLQVT